MEGVYRSRKSSLRMQDGVSKARPAPHSAIQRGTAALGLTLRGDGDGTNGVVERNEWTV
jgi:hypothetical protein